MSCDEAVMKKMGDDIRAEYSSSLLSFATGRKILAGAPLAFGEGDTRKGAKERAELQTTGFLDSGYGCGRLHSIGYLPYSQSPE
ncbi:MAG TPA: hypothetical protein PLF08_06425 [Bacillota bacterium]|nr:hypothetical protein [Bacillota bacterium]HPZ78734.1 hypothetical protein [Bacillota bacterium]HQD74806.1 hypothetical protein [Bacillota bacterium]